MNCKCDALLHHASRVQKSQSTCLPMGGDEAHAPIASIVHKAALKRQAAATARAHPLVDGLACDGAFDADNGVFDGAICPFTPLDWHLLYAPRVSLRACSACDPQHGQPCNKIERALYKALGKRALGVGATPRIVVRRAGRPCAGGAAAAPTLRGPRERRTPARCAWPPLRRLRGLLLGRLLPWRVWRSVAGTRTLVL